MKRLLVLLLVAILLTGCLSSDDPKFRKRDIEVSRAIGTFNYTVIESEGFGNLAVKGKTTIDSISVYEVRYWGPNGIKHESLILYDWETQNASLILYLGTVEDQG